MLNSMKNGVSEKDKNVAANAAEVMRGNFPHSGMVSLVALMQSGAAIETATIGRAGVIGASTVSA
jgi:hypothetical protein